MNIDKIMLKASLLTGVPIQVIKSKSRSAEAIKARALVVEMCPKLGVRELGRLLNIDHSSVSYYRSGNMIDKWNIKSLLAQLRDDTIESESDQINFTYLGCFMYQLIR